MLVDDKRENIFSLTSLLEDLNVEVVSSQSGSESLQLMLEHEISLAILDIQMPEMDGFELAELMRGVERTRDIPIIFLTATTHTSNFEFKGYECGAVDFLFKPIDPFILKSKVQVFIQLAEQKQQLSRQVQELAEAKKIAEAAKEVAEEADRLKSSFLANMSHEIRTPLGALMGFAELLKSPMAKENEKNAYIDIIVRNGKNLVNLINEILDLSKVEAGHLEIENAFFSPREVAKEVVDLLAPEAAKNHVELSLQFSDRIPNRVNSDQLRFRQIVTNIVSNAIKFSPRGAVRISGDYTTDRDRNDIFFLIEDTGIGIQPNAIHRLFRSFTQIDPSITRKFGGTGLGLALSKKLAHLLDGDLTLVKSELGKGSTFKITIEDKKAQSAPIFESSTVGVGKGGLASPLKGINVLVVDDSEDNQLLVKSFLEKVGASVDFANNGQEGILSAEKKTYNIILMDSQMPVCDGLEATKILRAKGFKLPIVALTANAMKDERERSLQAGCTDYLSRPINWDHLIKTVVRLTTNEI